MYPARKTKTEEKKKNSVGYYCLQQVERISETLSSILIFQDIAIKYNIHSYDDDDDDDGLTEHVAAKPKERERAFTMSTYVMIFMGQQQTNNATNYRTSTLNLRNDT